MSPIAYTWPSAGPTRQVVRRPFVDAGLVPDSDVLVERFGVQLAALADTR
jgi:hypothetical protein